MKEGFLSYKTSKYRLNYFETPSGVKFVLNTDFSVNHPLVRDLLKNLYSQIFVEYVVKNPMYTAGETVNSELFTSKLDDMIRASTIFRAI